MNPSQIAKAARLDTSALGAMPARLEANTDQKRVPITFGWWAQTTSERVSKHFHLETLYRLDRVQHGCQARLVPSQFYGMSEAEARQYLASRQAALLPKLPAGYRWIGPQLIENVPGLPRCGGRSVPRGPAVAGGAPAPGQYQAYRGRGAAPARCAGLGLTRWPA